MSDVPASETRLYRKKLLQPMRPYVPGEDLSGVSVNAEDTPEVGGMIAVNPDNGQDRWYVAKRFFEDNYEVAAPQPPTDFEAMSKYALRDYIQEHPQPPTEDWQEAQKSNVCSDFRTSEVRRTLNLLLDDAHEDGADGQEWEHDGELSEQLDKFLATLERTITALTEERDFLRRAHRSDVACLEATCQREEAERATLATTREQLRAAEALLVRFDDALKWCSGSEDFGPWGKGRAGWKTEALPVIEDYARFAACRASEEEK